MHFYTTDASEVTRAITNSGYHLEGIACYVFDPTQPAPPGTTAFIRLYYGDRDAHFYTANPQEALTVLAGSGWKDEGTACYVYGAPQPNATDFFRRYNPKTSEHFYTADPTEAQSVLSSGFNDEGTACYVYTSGQAAVGTVPFYRLFK